MKTHTSEFKDEIKKLGKQLDSVITYSIGGNSVELGSDELNSITPHFEGAILKSIMKQLDIDSNVTIPIGTVINCQFGVRVRDDAVQDYRDNYDYINFGNYVVYDVEKQEDTNSYLITCYDKMLYSMVDYDDIGITYPITIRNYINAICGVLGLTFKNRNSTFANYNKQIPKELFLQDDGKTLGYTFRDIFDQLAQVTASTICINETDDELEIRYINNTNDTINEEYLKDINVNFGEQTKAINTIVLSRSGGSDNVYYPTTLPQNPVELKISDNQIMNGNDRSDYLPDIYNKLNGFQYYLNDFTSTGICYYNLCDRYNVQIGNNTYSCVMLNDEVDITQGLEEYIHADLPEETQTDYKKADKTDRRINQTNLIVDKQQGQIQALVDSTQDLTDYINVVEGDNQITLSNTMDSNGAINYIEITGITPLNLYPDMVYPSDLVFPNVLTTYVLIFENDDNYEEFYIDLGVQLEATDKIRIEPKKITITKTGQTIYEEKNSILTTFNGETKISVRYFDNTHLKCEYIKSNDFTKQFATQAELSSTFTITDSMISSKVSRNEIISEINQSAEEIQINASKINLNGVVTANENFKINEDGSVSINEGNISLKSDLYDSNMTFENDYHELGIFRSSINGLGANFRSTDNTKTIAYIGNNIGYGQIDLSDETNDSYVILNPSFLHMYDDNYSLGCEFSPTEGIYNKAVYNNTISATGNLYIESNGTFRRGTSSSQRYKTDIKNITDEKLNTDNLLKIPVRQFKYKKDYISENDERYNKEIVGFIVEEMEKVFPIAVDHNEDGTPEMWNSNIIVPAMLDLIQKMSKRIDNLEKEIKNLKEAR